MAWLLLAECRDVGIGAHADGDAEDDTGVQLQSNEEQGSRLPGTRRSRRITTAIGGSGFNEYYMAKWQARGGAKCNNVYKKFRLAEQGKSGHRWELKVQL
jgi:hypothetical protein